MTKEVDRLRAEIDELLKQAQDVDAQDDAALVRGGAMCCRRICVAGRIAWRRSRRR